jgi:type I restriction enzyme R subunit
VRQHGLFSEIFPGRSTVPKTLVFAKNDAHAEDIVHIVREEFGKGNEFCKKITYRTTGEKPEDLIASFRNSYNPRIAVTVDMISTGTDIKPLECLLFMRDVKSRVYFEQMKGRGTRTISSTDLRGVTPDAMQKTHFVIVDAVGVCERDKTDSQPLERKRSMPFEKLVMAVALGDRDEDMLSSLAGRLARLEVRMDKGDHQRLEQASGGRALKEVINDLLDALDPDQRIQRAQEVFQTETPTEEQVLEAAVDLRGRACSVFDQPEFRNTLIEIKQRSEQVIDIVSGDRLLDAGFTQERARTIVDTFRQFIQENRDELAALQLIYSKPYGQRHLTYRQIKELAEAIEKPPYHLTPEQLWQAYEQLQASKVRRAGPQRLLTDVISLVRFAIGESEDLIPYPQEVNARFERWLAYQQKVGRSFTAEQMEWLKLIRDHIATSLTIGMDDFEYAPFHEKGGPVKVYQLFGAGLDGILAELNQELAA